MDAEQQTDGDWLLRGKTYGVREEIRQLGGRWDREEQAWRLPPHVEEEQLAQLALLALEGMDPRERARHLKRQQLDGLECKDARFLGDTYPHREFLRSIGARWNPDANCWQLDGFINKDALFDEFHASQVPLVEEQCLAGRSIRVQFDFDSERHCLLAQHCRCSQTHTCDVCRYACCDQALFIEQDLYECPSHGKVMMVK